MTPLGEKLRELRLGKGVSQKEMAAALGVSAAYLSALEHGRRGVPTWVLLQKIIGYFNIINFDPKTGRMECVNAGHPPVLVASGAGSLRLLQNAVNPALGMGPVPMEAHESVLDPGEVLVMYTDGLTELRNSSKQMLGQQALGAGFARLCASGAGRPVSAIADKLTQMLEEFRGDQLPEDDQAFLLARRT